MCGGRVFILVMIVIAFIVAILGVTLPMQQMNIVMIITNFFEIMLPILAFAALIKYLLCGGSSHTAQKNNCGPVCKCCTQGQCGPACSCGPSCQCKAPTSCSRKPFEE